MRSYREQSRPQQLTSSGQMVQITVQSVRRHFGLSDQRKCRIDRSKNIRQHSSECVCQWADSTLVSAGKRKRGAATPRESPRVSSSSLQGGLCCTARRGSGRGYGINALFCRASQQPVPALVNKKMYMTLLRNSGPCTSLLFQDLLRPVGGDGGGPTLSMA